MTGKKIKKLINPLIKEIQNLAPTGAVLMYHRIAALSSDPWSLCVSTENFAAHLEVLKKHSLVMSLEELYGAHHQRQLPDRAVAITFDDGYADNLLAAKPLLEKAKLPATVFVASGCIDRQREFWWDELEKAILLPDELPERLTLKALDKARTWQFSSATYYSTAERERDRNIDPWMSDPTTRLGIYFSVWKFLWPLPSIEQERLCNEILAWAGVSTDYRESHRTLTTEELKQLDSSDYVKVGAHTVNHVHLPSHSVEVQQYEIETSKRLLEEKLGHSITTFSYPYGGFSKSTLKVIDQVGFDCACSTVESRVWWGSDRLQIPRFEVQNWDEKVFEERLLKWLDRNQTFSPSAVRKVSLKNAIA
jgi:peptidoglycan/xylan/chitin deacetylase (PgdA/CDA1 family)